MTSVKYKAVEFLIIFIIIPLSFALDYSPFIKMGIGLIGFMYVIYVLRKVEKEKFKLAPNLNWTSFWKSTITKLLVIALITFIFVWQTNKNALFFVMLNKPQLWVFILFVYTFLSVYPQELIYRTFYFKRYGVFIKNTKLFIFLNALVFSLAHILFKNTLVLILTFLGGILFALTFTKTKSTLLVSIEHAIYGCWLFTVGMGEMLGFPT
ncbi:MAG: CPBP family intramembrane glutamic endopeptidase [Jejuia sp.]